MTINEWLRAYGQLLTCDHWHRAGHHERDLCPVPEAMCDYIKASVMTHREDAALIARYAGELAASAYRELTVEIASGARQ